MASAIGLLITKKMTYRSNTDEEWSNKYWLTGTPPTTVSAWRALFDSLVTLERECYAADCTVVRGAAWDSNDEHAFSVWGVDLELEGTPVPGTLPEEPGFKMAGDQAGMVEWKTTRKNSRGKWVYLRKYFHHGFQAAGDADYVSAATQAAYDTLGQQLTTGIGSGFHRIRSQLQDEGIQSHIVSPFMTTRTLKRRGKKKGTTP